MSTEADDVHHRQHGPYGRGTGDHVSLTHLQPEDRRAVEGLWEGLIGTARLGVAFSGGVDSSVLLALAVEALGPDRVLALLGISPSLASDEREAAHRVATHVGVPVVEVPTFEGHVGVPVVEVPTFEGIGPTTGATARTAASTARTSSSSGSPRTSCPGTA